MEDGTIIGDVKGKGQGICHWVIPNFSTLPQRVGSRFKSQDFGEVKGADWRLEIYPNGISYNPRILIKVRRTSIFERVPISCTVGVRPADYAEETLGTKIIHPLSFSSYTFKRTRSELENEHSHWLPDGDLTVTILFGEADESQGDTQLSENLKALLTDEDYDVKIFVKGREFHAHRLILKARSPALRMMLVHDSKEKKSGTIHIEDCDPDCFEEFLLFLYSGRTANLTVTKALHLFYAAEKYELSTLKQHCVHFLEASLSETSVWDVIRLAVKHGEEELLQRVAKYFAKNLKTILFTSEWTNFWDENPVVANELLIKIFQNLGHL